MKRSNRVVGLLAGLGMLTLLSGCQVNETGTLMADGEGSTWVVDSKSRQLWGGLTVADMKSAWAGNLLRGQVVLRNIDDETEVFRYKFAWYDKDGFEIAIDGLPWTPITVTGHESKTIQSVAPNPSATTFKVMIQDVDD